MYTDGFVRVLYHRLEISGAKVNVFECGIPPINEYGDTDIDELFRQTYATDNSQKNVFYEAYLSGTNKVLYTSKTPPTDEELIFQLRKYQHDESEKNVIIIWVVVGLFVLYLLFK